MKIKGVYNSATSYNVGDVVRDSDGGVYVLQYPATAGTDPKNNAFWGRVAPIISDAASFAIDAMESAVDEVEKYFVNDQTLLLKAGEGDEEKTYAVTVDNSGDTPEIAVEEVSDEE